jgi:cellulose synthase/poly-beta-1,6-N-acetylglucosamine synthase-like glycosyltransferase
MIWIIICYVLLVGYIFLIAFYYRHWLAVTEFSGLSKDPSTFISIIIPARNEAENIQRCLDSLFIQNYPSAKFEIIVVDDHSSDQTSVIVKRYDGVTLLELKDMIDPGFQGSTFKKLGIETAISQARGNLIITTDADCVLPPYWLGTIENYYRQQKPALVAGPVRMVPGGSFLSIFQAIDFAILQGITAASMQARFHPMGNGANLAYEKSVFLDLGGYRGDELASGDDMLLIQKVATRYPARVTYLKSKSAIVDTRPEPDWSHFFSQRIRWAGKTGRYKDPKLIWVWLGVYLLNLSLVIAFIYACFNPFYFTYLILLLLLKTGIEWKFVKELLRFFDLQRLLKWFLPSQPVHIIYIVITGFLSRVSGTTWKGRHIK